MGTIASQITSPTIVYSTVYSDADQRKNIKAPRHWPLCREFTGTGEFPAQMASYAENVSIWWRRHVLLACCWLYPPLRTNFSKILSKIKIFAHKKINSRLWSPIWWSFCLSQYTELLRPRVIITYTHTKIHLAITTVDCIFYDDNLWKINKTFDKSRNSHRFPTCDICWNLHKIAATPWCKINVTAIWQDMKADNSPKLFELITASKINLYDPFYKHHFTFIPELLSNCIH